jgi:hypothetical protein
VVEDYDIVAGEFVGEEAAPAWGWREKGDRARERRGEDRWGAGD